MFRARTRSAVIATLLVALAVTAGGVAGVQLYGVKRIMSKLTGQRFTVDSVVAALDPRLEPLWAGRCTAAGVPFPPPRLILLGFKEERTLEVWTDTEGDAAVLLHSYPVLGASGGPGPKLREGDLQVPEGVYRVAVLNPMSRFHLSLGLDYPNAFDRARGADDGRENLGSDIYIHGGNASVGCLAMGDPAIEELFWLVARIGEENVTVVLASNDARDGAFVVPDGAPTWIGAVHDQIREAWEALGG